MKMKLTGGLGLLLVTALATGEALPETRVTLVTGPEETNVPIFTSKEGLHLGQTRLEPWPYAVPDCDGCTLTLERDFSPVGPDRTLILAAPGATQPTWFFADRLRLPASLPGGAVLRAQTGPELGLESGGERATLSVGEPLWLEGCQYHLIWYDQPTPPAASGVDTTQNPEAAALAPQPEIIAEDPTQHVQVQGQCR